MRPDPQAGCRFRDRLTGRCAPAPPETATLPGRWILEGNTSGVWMNSAPVAAGDFLVPDSSGHWLLRANDGAPRGGRMDPVQRVDDLEAKSVRALADRLEELTNDGAGWLEWIDVVPLAPGLSELSDERDLEQVLREYFGHLENVCRKPRAHLQVEIERVRVARARRVPARAVSYLAAHTEDWDRRLLQGLLPKRILAEYSQDELDIYENRVVARLLDHLGAYLNQRIRALRRLLKIFQDKEDYSSAIAGTHWRRQRMSQLWGQSIDANEGRLSAEVALRRLEALKYRLMGLLDSQLYRRIPRRALVATTLMTTNILTNDPHYRRVAEIWREWGRTGAGRTPTPAQIHAEAQRLCRGLDAFAMLLTVGALDTLGYEPTRDAHELPIARGVTLPLHGRGQTPSLFWQSDGTLSLTLDQRQLTIVAVAANLAAGGGPLVEATLKQIRKAVGERGNDDLLVLFLASEEGPLSSDSEILASLHTVGNDPRHARSGAGCLPVSPWEIGSTERIARALRWFLSSALFLDYPRTVKAPESVRDGLDLRAHARWLVRRENDSILELRRPPEEFEWQAVDLDSMRERAEAASREASEQRRQLASELRGAVRQGSTGNLNRRKHGAKEESERRERIAREVKEFADQLRRAHEASLALLPCPTCSHRANPSRDFEPREGGCFCCTCPDCGTVWETRRCPQGHRFAAIQPGGKFLDGEHVKHTAGWEDRLYGCDLLALPVRSPDGWRPLCPECPPDRAGSSAP